MRRFTALRGAGMCAALALMVVGVLGFSASAFANSETFKPVGHEQAYTVPAGVTQVEVAATGGAGQGVANCNFGYAAGGSGAKITAQLSVIGIKTLYVDFGGGGSGGAPVDCAGGESVNGGAGGGASDVRTEPGSLSSRLIVAGGGGGGGYGRGSVYDETGISYVLPYSVEGGQGGSAEELAGSAGASAREFGEEHLLADRGRRRRWDSRRGRRCERERRMPGQR